MFDDSLMAMNPPLATSGRSPGVQHAAATNTLTPTYLDSTLATEMRGQEYYADTDPHLDVLPQNMNMTSEPRTMTYENAWHFETGYVQVGDGTNTPLTSTQREAVERCGYTVCVTVSAANASLTVTAGSNATESHGNEMT